MLQIFLWFWWTCALKKKKKSPFSSLPLTFYYHEQKKKQTSISPPDPAYYHWICSYPVALLFTNSLWPLKTLLKEKPCVLGISLLLPCALSCSAFLPCLLGGRRTLHNNGYFLSSSVINSALNFLCRIRVQWEISDLKANILYSNQSQSRQVRELTIALWSEFRIFCKMFPWISSSWNSFLLLTPGCYTGFSLVVWVVAVLYFSVACGSSLWGSNTPCTVVDSYPLIPGSPPKLSLLSWDLNQLCYV